MSGFSEGWAVGAGMAEAQARTRLEQNRNQLAWRQLAMQEEERHKREADAGKAAEFFFKANPDALTQVGMTEQQFKNLSASQQSAAALGFVQGQAQKQVMQQLAQEAQQARADAAFGRDVSGVYGRNALQTLARGNGPVIPPGVTPDQITAGLSADAWQSKRAEPLLNYHLLAGGNKTLTFVKSPTGADIALSPDTGAFQYDPLSTAANRTQMTDYQKAELVNKARERYIAAKRQHDTLNAMKDDQFAQSLIPGAKEAMDSAVEELKAYGITVGQPAANASKPLDQATAAAILKETGGDKAKARELAKQRGYTF